MVTLRPEQIALVSKETAVPHGLSGTSAVVLEVVYVGSRTRVRSQLPNGLELWAEVPPSTAPAVGEEVGVRWSVADALILTG